jgi:uncharacterized protein YjbI with pentapeptide repeats
MSGARLTGRFRLIDGAAVVLTDAVLTGSFKSVDFAGANLERAILSGVFYEVSFRAINFQGVSLRGASLINVDFQNARNLSDAQLQQAVRLRGSTLPDGTRYDNRFNLPGDREDAPHAGVNPDDPVAMARFCANVKPTYNPNT